MSDNHEIAHRLLTERKAVETLYQAFSLQQPDLVNEAVTADWADIPLAPGQGQDRKDSSLSLLCLPRRSRMFASLFMI
jgi:hypothetical protein